MPTRDHCLCGRELSSKPTAHAALMCDPCYEINQRIQTYYQPKQEQRTIGSTVVDFAKQSPASLSQKQKQGNPNQTIRSWDDE